MKKSHPKGFIWLFLAIIALSLVIAWPFLQTIVMAILTVIVLYPLYQKLANKVKLPSWILVSVILLVLLLAFVIPVAMIAGEIVNQLIRISANLEESSLTTIIASVNDLLISLNLEAFVVEQETILKELSGLANTLANDIFALLVNIGGFSVDLLTKLSVYLILIYWLLPNFKQITEFLVKIAPLEKKISHTYISKIQLITQDLVRGSLIIAFIQTVLAGIAFIITGIPNLGLLLAATFIFSVIPLIGSYFVTIPAAIYLFSGGAWLQAGFLIIWQVLLLANVDNFLRPFLFRKEVQPPPLLAFLVIIVFTAVFGIAGIIYGPIFLIILITTVRIFEEYSS